MKLGAKTRLMASMALSLADWKSLVSKKHPKAKFTKENGSGKTYGEKGDWCAHTGPDMQADVVGVYSLGNEFCSVIGKDGDEVEYDTKS